MTNSTKIDLIHCEEHQKRVIAQSSIWGMVRGRERLDEKQITSSIRELRIMMTFTKCRPTQYLNNNINLIKSTKILIWDVNTETKSHILPHNRSHSITTPLVSRSYPHTGGVVPAQFSPKYTPQSSASGASGCTSTNQKIPEKGSCELKPPILSHFI